MTDDKPMRDDDVQVVLDAIRMIKRVADVTLDERCLDDYRAWQAKEDAKRELKTKLWDMLR